MKPPCSNCQRPLHYARGLCYPCYQYQRRTGRPRPAELIDPAKPALDCRICRNCRRGRVVAQGRCHACCEFYRVNGRERPLHLIDRDAPCRRCGAPRSAYRNGWTRGLCNPCYTYRKRTGKPRPKHLIQRIAPHGWCECGRPAAGEYRLANLTIDRGKRVEYTERLCVVCAREEGAA